MARATPRPELAAQFHDYLQRARTLGERRLREHPGDADAHFQVGAAFGFDASYPATVEGRVLARDGYAATPLTGVWANFPYLHNGSVPTLHHLLGPASERPAIFEVMAARTLDRVRVGQPLFRDPRHGRLSEAELIRRFGQDRNWFNTGRPGSANTGHDFWYRIRTDANRRALIEYLKTL